MFNAICKNGHTIPEGSLCRQCEKPEHDSLYVRFEQLDQLLVDAIYTPYADECRDAAIQARALAKLIRTKVLK